MSQKNSTGADSLRIEVVANQKQVRDFFSLRKKLYTNDPAAVFPLQSMERLQLDTDKHPFYEHATREMFVCYRDSTVVGRVVAIKDVMHNEHNDDRVGFFGFFEAIDDQAVVDELISAAAEWLKKNGCDSMRGPVNPSMKSDFGVVVDGNEHSPMIMMGYSKRRYKEQLEKAGLAVAQRFFAFRFRAEEHKTSEDNWERLRSAEARILKRYPKIELRPVNDSNFEETMREVNALGNVVRSEGWGFVPLTKAELAFMVKNLRRVIQYDKIHVAYWDGELVGYIVTIPDVNWALKRAKGRWDWLRMLQMPRLLKRTPKSRVIALGVDENYRNKGVAMLLILQLVEMYDAFEEWEFSWVLESNLRSIRAIGRTIPLVKTKTYELFEKTV
jgi:GNAT superfamily N-acetyltransferase